MPPAVVFLAGVIIVVGGAEMLLRSAARVAEMLGVGRVMIGLTIVSVGTSTPELAVGITAVREGSGALAVGNIAGTNILNILFILGLSAAIRPLPVRRETVRLDVPVMIGTALALILMSLDRVLTRVEGALLLLVALFYTVVVVRSRRAEGQSAQPAHSAPSESDEAPVPRRGLAFARQASLLVAGMALTGVGAHWLVAGAVDMAEAYGVSDAFIGLTIVAIGTSAPELVTTLLSTFKNDRDVAIGNLIGSSIYNILVILGLTMLAAPQGIEVGPDILWIDLPLAAIVAVACLPVFRSDRLVSRREGAAFVAAYLAYLATLVVLRA